MGRRRKRSRQEDGGKDELDSYESEWLLQRAKCLKHQRIEIADDLNGGGERVTETPVSSQSSKHLLSDDNKTSSHNESTKTPNTSSEQEKIDRLKLKKQRQKERRKEKRAAAAASNELAKKHKVELEKSAQIQKQQQLEKKKKLKETHATQSFRTLPKGVKCLDLTIGKGPPVKHRKKIHVSYTLRAKSHTNGKIIDSSKNFGFRLGKGEVIQGWDIGLEGMRVGGVRRLVVPPAAGYGNKNVGAGKGADLFFEIELLHVAP